MKDGGVDTAMMAAVGKVRRAALLRRACYLFAGLRSIRFSVAKPSGAHRPGCKLGVSLLLPPSLLYLGALRNIFLFRRLA